MNFMELYENFIKDNGFKDSTQPRKRGAAPHKPNIASPRIAKRRKINRKIARASRRANR